MHSACHAGFTGLIHHGICLTEPSACENPKPLASRNEPGLAWRNDFLHFTGRGVIGKFSIVKYPRGEPRTFSGVGGRQPPSFPFQPPVSRQWRRKARLSMSSSARRRSISARTSSSSGTPLTMVK